MSQMRNIARKTGHYADNSQQAVAARERDAYYRGLSEIFDFSGEDETVQGLGLEGWTSHAADALLRTSRGATPLHRDTWTVVADSTAGGNGLFAAKKLPAAFVLYTYAGVQRTAADASRRPNAYQFDLKSGAVCDASDERVASAARFVNTKGSYAIDNNCVFKEHQATVYLITTKEIKPFEELFAPYGIADEIFPSWSLAFLGDPHEKVDEYKSYLNTPPAGVTAAQRKEAKQLLTWLKQDLAVDEVTTSLEAASPLLEVLSALLGMLDMRELENLLKSDVKKHDLEIRYWADQRFQGGGASLEHAEKLKRLAEDKIEMLQKCKQLQEPCGSTVSALRHALSQIQAMQAEAPLNGKKRKRGQSQAK